MQELFKLLGFKKGMSAVAVAMQVAKLIQAAASALQHFQREAGPAGTSAAPFADGNSQ